MDQTQKIDFIFDGGRSKRYHTCDLLKEQDIAAHSFGVAWFCEVITRGHASKDLIMAALAHDLAEHIVGDVPGPSKRAMGMREILHQHENGFLREVDLSKYDEALDDNERRILHMADQMEGLVFCIRERSLGNKKITKIFENFLKYTLETKPYPYELSIIKHLTDKWEYYNEGK